MKGLSLGPQFFSFPLPTRIFLSNPDLTAKLEQEEKQWRVDLCPPKEEGLHPGKNGQGETEVERARTCLGRMES